MCHEVASSFFFKKKLVLRFFFYKIVTRKCETLFINVISVQPYSLFTTPTSWFHFQCSRFTESMFWLLENRWYYSDMAEYVSNCWKKFHEETPEGHFPHFSSCRNVCADISEKIWRRHLSHLFRGPSCCFVSLSWHSSFFELFAPTLALCSH